MNAKVMQSIREVVGKQEAILLDFVTSGAMIRDLAVERSQMEWVEVEPMVYCLRQEFRVI